MSFFSLIGTTDAEVRTMISGEPFGLNPNEEGIAGLEKTMRWVAQTKVVDAWEHARSRIQERRRLEAEQCASRSPVTPSMLSLTEVM